MKQVDHPLDADQRFRLAKEVVLQTFTGKALFVDLNSERVYQLNETGAQVARLLEEGQSLGEMLAALDQGFQAGPGELERDVRRLLGELLEQGLVEKLKDHQ